MSSLSFLRSMAVALLMTAAAKAQSARDDGAEPPPATVPPGIVQPPTILVEGGEPQPAMVSHPIGHAVDGAGRVFDADWLGLSTRPVRYKAWASAEYVVMWLNGAATPPLITSSASGVPIGPAAAVGPSTTATRLGGNDLNSNPTSALRFTVGSWLNSRADQGLELGGFFLGNRTNSFSISGTGLANSIALGRPLIDAASGSETVLYTAFAGRFAGSASASQNTNLWGIDANGLLRMTDAELPFFFGVTGGVRYIDLDQSLAIQNETTPVGTGTIPVGGGLTLTSPNFVRVTDSFQTSNRFIGGQLGLRTGFDLGRLGLGVGFKLGLGVTHQSVSINGQSEAFTSAGQSIAVVPGGLLANASNIGHIERETLGVVPECQLKISYRLMDNLHAYFGYNYLIWNHVAMPGSQFSRTVNVNNVPTSGSFNVGNGAVGSVPNTQTDLTLSSIAFGFCLTY